MVIRLTFQISFEILDTMKAGYSKAFRGQRGQAMTELIIALLTIVMILTSAVQLVTIAREQLHARIEIRSERGCAAISSDAILPSLPDPSDASHFAYLARTIDTPETASAFSSTSSQLPLSAFEIPSAKVIGFTQQEKEHHIVLDDFFAKYVYGKPSFLIREAIYYPSLGGFLP